MTRRYRDAGEAKRKLERKKKALQLADLMDVAAVSIVEIHGIGVVKLPPMGKK